MSKIAADEMHGGNTLRKVIDYFSHLAVVPSYYDYIATHDMAFSATPYLQKLKWLRDDTETVYDPECDDVIRVAFMHKLKRAKLSNLVSMLSGRNFETREFKEEIVEQTYTDFTEGVLNVINEFNFKQFMIAIKSAGFISSKLVNSNMALDFAYTIYLLLKESKEVPVENIKRFVQKWYVLSVLTGRYSSSPESAFARDIRRIRESGVVKILKEIEDAQLSDNFWNVALVQDLSYTSTNNPTYLVFLAAQIFFNDISFLSNNVPVRELIALGGDVHHIFPKQYLIDNHYDKSRYNQEANFVYLDRPVNISIGKKAPYVYLQEAEARCQKRQRRHISQHPETDHDHNDGFYDRLRNIDRFKLQRREHDPQIFVRQNRESRKSQDRQQDIIADCLNDMSMVQRLHRPARSASRAVKAGQGVERAGSPAAAVTLIDPQQDQESRHRNGDQHSYY